MSVLDGGVTIMADHATIPSGLVKWLEIEGSSLIILKASEHNLDWTYQASYHNGATDETTVAKAVDLRMALFALSTSLQIEAEKC